MLVFKKIWFSKILAYCFLVFCASYLSGPPLMRGKPVQHPLLKLLMCSRPGHSVACLWNQPKLHMIWSGSSDKLRVMRRDVPVFFSVNQQDRHR